MKSHIFTCVIISTFLTLTLCKTDYDYDYNTDNKPKEDKKLERKKGDMITKEELEMDYNEMEPTDEFFILGMKPGDEETYRYTKQMHGRSFLSTVVRYIEGAYDKVSKYLGDFTKDDDNSKEMRAKQNRYLLRDNSGNWMRLKRDGSDAKMMWMNGSNVKVLIHGFTPNLEYNVNQKILKSKLFKIGDAYASTNMKYNIIICDWTQLSSYIDLQYYRAVQGAPFAAMDIGMFLIKLKDLGLIESWEQVHIIGFSLGAQVAGMVGSYIKEHGGGPVARITGLDPAGPLFSEDGELPENKTHVLDSDDATFVDVIHCNMGEHFTSGLLIKAGRLGTAAQSGHADFYPNGGEKQPKCSYSADLGGSCSHHKCPTYFLQSISQGQLACPCDDWSAFALGNCTCTEEQGAMMGEHCANSTQGKFYLTI